MKSCSTDREKEIRDYFYSAGFEQGKFDRMMDWIVLNRKSIENKGIPICPLCMKPMKRKKGQTHCFTDDCHKKLGLSLSVG